MNHEAWNKGNGDIIETIIPYSIFILPAFGMMGLCQRTPLILVKKLWLWAET